MKSPKAVETAPAPRGGSYLADPVTGALTPLFIPESGMNPDGPGVAAIPAPDADNKEPV